VSSLNNTRREIMKLLGVVPGAVPLASAELTAALKNPVATAAAAVAKTLPQPDRLGRDAQCKAARLFGKAFENKLRRLEQRSYGEMECRRQSRNRDGFDHDLASMKSLSGIYRQKKQMDRDQETYDLIEQAREWLDW
jgi:hypothetical protein